MYKVMIADDDYPVIEFLKEKIPWNDLNLMLTHTAEDGLSALEQAETDMPDILITDIGMPGMDGMELIHALKQIHPGLQTIILSCHDEFEYTRQAVQLSVQDYVLKESMDIQAITDIVKKLVVCIDDERDKSRRNENMIHLVRQHQLILKEKLLTQILTSPLLKEAEIKEFGVDFAQHDYLSIICYINSFAKQLERFKSSEVLAYAVNNIIDEIITPCGQMQCFHLNSKELLLLFPCSKAAYAVHPIQLVMNTLQDIQSAVHKYIHINLSFIIGDRACNGISELRGAINKLMASSGQRFYLPEPVIIDLGRTVIPYTDEDIFSYYAEVSESFGELLTDEMKDQTVQIISRWFQFFQARRFHPEDVRSFILKIAMDQHVKVRLSAQYLNFELSKEQLHQEILLLESLSELQEWLIRFWKSLISAVSIMSKQSRRMEIVTAQKYVARNIHQKVTLEEVSEFLHLNSNYFSRLFKRETNETFIGYVTRVKMNKAKELLETTNKTVNDIALQVGYDNKSYFNKCFKAIYMLSPAQYVQNMGSVQTKPYGRESYKNE